MQNFKTVLRSAGRLPSLLLKATLEVVMSIMRVFAQLLGVRFPEPTLLPMPSLTPGEVKADLVQAVERKLGNNHAPTSELGSVVYEFVTSHPASRHDVDISSLSSIQKSWLLSLSDRDLARLVKAGPSACQRAVNGQRSGVVGLAELGQATPEDRQQTREERIQARLRDRILGRHGFAPVR